MRAAAVWRCIEVSANCEGLKGGISLPQLLSDEKRCRCAQAILGSVFTLPLTLTHAHCFPLAQSSRLVCLQDANAAYIWKEQTNEGDDSWRRYEND